jgi:hypothetical protein
MILSQLLLKDKTTGGKGRKKLKELLRLHSALQRKVDRDGKLRALSYKNANKNMKTLTLIKM